MFTGGNKLKTGIYEEIINVHLKNELELLEESKHIIEKEVLDVEEARKFLSTYIYSVTRRALNYVRDIERNDKDALLRQIHTCNKIIQTLGSELNNEEFAELEIDNAGEVLQSVYLTLNSNKIFKKKENNRPVTSIAESTLFTGAPNEPNMLSELKKEIVTADQVDLLVSFIKWSGIRCLMTELRELTNNGGKLRVLTTSYMEATDYKAILELSKLENTEIKVSYDTERTRLHAKAYVFRRSTGFTTAYVGSSNLSHSALTDGLEWNMKITERDSKDVLDKVHATFQGYWNDKEFKLFNGEDELDRKQLEYALSKETVRESSPSYLFDIQPYYYQKEMLENLQVEREVFGRYKNLLVAATGVGKTVISSFDFKRYYEKSEYKAKLLFVAHREEILKQSRDTFRAILKDPNFGDLLVGTHRPASIDYLFISIQSFNSMKMYENVSSDFYDFIIIDEFHHAAAPSYQKILTHFKPEILLGLTATPERMDGQDILKYFDGVIASEMRLPEAIDRKLLSPFQYFCVSDTVDLSNLKWSRRGYQVSELQNIYTNNSIRSEQIYKSLIKYVTDIEKVIGLGFCAGVEHAKYMAHYFNSKNIPSIALHGGTDSEERRLAKVKLERGEIKFIFVADLYNEGIDIPKVNTILFLRPTESLTIFLQQLGRGLRISNEKECLTVLDFVGQAHQNYNFEEKFRALVGKTRHSIQQYVDEGFSNLPRGSFIELEKQAKEYVLRNLKSAKLNKNNLKNMLKNFESITERQLTLQNFLEYHNLSLYDFYGRSANRTFHRLCVEANVAEDFVSRSEEVVTKRINKLFHLNSRKLLKFYLNFIKGTDQLENLEESRLMLNMLYYTFYLKTPEKLGFSSIDEGINVLLENAQMKEEILSVLNYNYEHIQKLEIENNFDFVCPLTIHSNYSTDQILAGLGYFNEESRPEFREGVKHFKDRKLDVFFATINKSGKEYSNSTNYENYVINERLFHWQTQNSVGGNTANRYIKHQSLEHSINLFVRENKSENGYTTPFTFLGESQYVEHYGEKPISFIWRLKHELPMEFITSTNSNVM